MRVTNRGNSSSGLRLSGLANPSREQDESVECPTCRKRLSSRSILIRHLCETHQTNLHQEPINIRTFRCLEAGCKSGPFKRKSQLCSHKQTKHNYGPKDSGKGELHSTSNSESFQQDPEHPHLPIFEKEAQEVGQDSVKLYSLAPKPANSKNREKFIQIPFLEVSDTELPNEGNGAAIIDQALPNANRSYSKLPQSSIEIDGFQDNFLENYAEPNFIDSIPGISTTQNLLLLSSKTGLNRDNRIPPDYSLKDSNGEFNLFFDQKDEMPESDLFSSMGSAGLSKPKSHFRFEDDDIVSGGQVDIADEMTRYINTVLSEKRAEKDQIEGEIRALEILKHKKANRGLSAYRKPRVLSR